MKQMLNNAILLAARHHDGQFDKGGTPYILHVLKVMHYLKTDDEELMCIAVLHDIIEDTKCTFEELKCYQISERVIAAVDLLTKKKDQANEDYLEGILTNKDAMLVKMCDLRHNMDARRLKSIHDKQLREISEKEAKRLIKYANMRMAIERKLNAIGANV